MSRTVLPRWRQHVERRRVAGSVRSADPGTSMKRWGFVRCSGSKRNSSANRRCHRGGVRSHIGSRLQSRAHTVDRYGVLAHRRECVDEGLVRQSHQIQSLCTPTQRAPSGGDPSACWCGYRISSSFVTARSIPAARSRSRLSAAA